MAVKGPRETQGAATRQALLTSARQLFGAQGYAATSVDEVVRAAGVTKGALYHHFGDKVELFRAVFEEVEREVSDRAVAEFLGPDSWEALVTGCRLWVDAHLDAGVRQISLTDARSVLGGDTARSIENRFSVVGLRGALRKAVTAGDLDPQPLRPLALMLMGALREACLYVAEAEDPAAARDEVGELVVGLLRGLRSNR
jgi:AcrR family transcriptional regulator